MNLRSTSHLRVRFHFLFVTPTKVQLCVLGGTKKEKKKENKRAGLLFYQNEGYMQKLLYWLQKGFIFPLQVLFLYKRLSYSSLPCKDCRERSKNTSKGTILFFFFFLPEILFVERIFLLWPWPESNWLLSKAV